MGLGTSPLGLSQAGFAEPVEAPEPPVATQFVRAIDQATRDYGIDPVDGGFARTLPVRQRVQLALSTAAGSSTTLPEWGLSRPRKQGDAFEAQMDASLRLALRQLVEVERLVAIESIRVERGQGGRAKAILRFRDLTTEQTFQEGVILG